MPKAQSKSDSKKYTKKKSREHLSSSDSESETRASRSRSPARSGQSEERSISPRRRSSSRERSRSSENTVIESSSAKHSSDSEREGKSRKKFKKSRKNSPTSSSKRKVVERSPSPKSEEERVDHNKAKKIKRIFFNKGSETTCSKASNSKSKSRMAEGDDSDKESDKERGDNQEMKFLWVKSEDTHDGFKLKKSNSENYIVIPKPASIFEAKSSSVIEMLTVIALFYIDAGTGNALVDAIKDGYTTIGRQQAICAFFQLGTCKVGGKDKTFCQRGNNVFVHCCALCKKALGHTSYHNIMDCLIFLRYKKIYDRMQEASPDQKIVRVKLTAHKFSQVKHVAGKFR